MMDNNTQADPSQPDQATNNTGANPTDAPSPQPPEMDTALPPADQPAAQTTDGEADPQDWQPRTPQKNFPIVGIGASAGGLEAFEKFFTHVQPDCGIAFVLVQHLDPTHESLLTDIVQRYTKMQVFQVQDGMEIERNCVYIIPPNRDMSLMHGRLHLSEPEAARGLRLPIDFFFRSLAEDLQERAICIILSGTGTDGTQGLRAIKGEGGMAMVQTPSSAKYDGMPQSAIATGMVDYTLPSEDMPDQLQKYVNQEFVPGPRKTAPRLMRSTDTLQKVFLALRSQTGHDFSHYKQNTLMRRIERRMTVNQIRQVTDYVRFLQHNPLEVDTLFRELLIGVTSFFRDREAFQALEQKVIAGLFDQYAAEEPIRIWIPGCSTGEEAYSIAILLREQMETLRQEQRVQIFATDIDNHAIDKARIGIYPDSIAADISSERLRRFFSKSSNTYQISNLIRDMVVFAVQSVIKDPPFSNLQLISCRNLLIYLGPELQKRVVPLFHYALAPGGFLFLGTSETLGEAAHLFTTVERKWALFQKSDTRQAAAPVFQLAAPMFTDLAQEHPTERTALRGPREVVEQALLTSYAPSSVMINDQGDVLYFYGRTNKYLEHPTGEGHLNVFHMARGGLHFVLPSAVREAVSQHEEAIRRGIQIQIDGITQVINLRIRPLYEGQILIVFEEIATLEETDAQEVPPESTDARDQQIISLQQEVRSTREYLQTIIEELHASNEEVKSTNEELQSSNEELQSTNEELETSKEELQSVNEELVTVNTELRNKIEQLSRANNDQKNLLASMEVGTIFLDQALRIVRFTPSASRMIKLIDSDVGRPLGDLTSNIVQVDVVQEALSVLNNLQIRETEVCTTDGRWYALRTMPYRTTQNVVDGVILTFSDITQQKAVQAELERKEHFLNSIYNGISLPIFVVDITEDGQFVHANNNPASKHFLEQTAHILPGKQSADLHAETDAHSTQDVYAQYRRCVETGEPVEYQQQLQTTEQEDWWQIRIVPLRNDDGRVFRLVGTAYPIKDKHNDS